ncbi:hypothetical protein R3P38DRAFT_2800541 [Favolaschia claudopus]|uniref:Uncharacterized protein n=1 Tax=Favolaschia claudopus TaxID=2862362 RepID=A0AAV9ZXC9_9AGAR
MRGEAQEQEQEKTQFEVPDVQFQVMIEFNVATEADRSMGVGRRGVASLVEVATGKQKESCIQADPKILWVFRESESIELDDDDAELVAARMVVWWRSDALPLINDQRSHQPRLFPPLLFVHSHHLDFIVLPWRTGCDVVPPIPLSENGTITSSLPASRLCAKPKDQSTRESSELGLKGRRVSNCDDFGELEVLVATKR